jgi:hypothetical protein
VLVSDTFVHVEGLGGVGVGVDAGEVFSKRRSTLTLTLGFEISHGDVVPRARAQGACEDVAKGGGRSCASRDHHIVYIWSIDL